MEECRIIIEFDGCFLKSACKTELLITARKNVNNQMFSIAWIVIDKKIKYSWIFLLIFETRPTAGYWSRYHCDG